MCHGYPPQLILRHPESGAPHLLGLLNVAKDREGMDQVMQQVHRLGRTGRCEGIEGSRRILGQKLGFRTSLF